MATLKKNHSKNFSLDTLDSEILRHRGDTKYLDDLIILLTEIKRKLDIQIDMFLEKYCQGVKGLEMLDSVDNSNPLVRFYNAKRNEYSQVERLIRIAKAYK